MSKILRFLLLWATLIGLAVLVAWGFATRPAETAVVFLVGVIGVFAFAVVYET